MAENDFRKALLWHMDKKSIGASQLARGAGVSSDVIKKLRTRPGSSTSAETATRIARYFGKDMADFIALREDGANDDLHKLIDLLSDQDRQFLLRQIQGLLNQSE